MADLKKIVQIVFSGVDDISGQLTKMSRNIDSFGNDLQDIGEPFANATEKVALLNAAIAGIAVAGIKVSSDIETEAKKMAYSLGLPIDEAQKFETIAKEVYKAGFGDDLIQVFETVTLAQKKLGDNASVDIGKVSEQALKLEKVFHTDVNESLQAVQALMSNFGLTSEQAFNFITLGFQKGLNGSDDFLESINEYSTQFSNGGADAGQFFSVLQTGFQQGVLGTDKAADAFKEFRVRIQDESKTTNDALLSLGIDPVVFGQKMASGEMTAIQAFQTIIQKLNETQDETVKFNAGVGLIGTQFEDLGTRAALSIDTTKTKIGELDVALQGVDTESFAKKFTSAIRTIVTEFGDLKEWEDVKNKVAEVFTDIAKNFDESIDQADFSSLERAVGELWDTLVEAFKERDFDLTTIEGMQNAIEFVIESLKTLTKVTDGIVEVIEPVIDTVILLTKAFNAMPDRVKEATGTILGLGSALVVVGGAFKVGGALLGGLSTLTGLVSSGGALSTGLAALIALFTGPLGLAAAVATVSAGVLAWASAIDETDAAHQKLLERLEEQREKVQGVSEQIKDLPSGVNTIEIWAAVDRGELDEAQKMINDITEKEHLTKVRTEVDNATFDNYWDKLTKLPPSKQTELTALMNKGDFGAVEKFFEDLEKKSDIEVMSKLDVTSAEKTQKDIEKNIPSDRVTVAKIENQTKTELAKIKTDADIVQTAMEWEAKLDIAEVEAQSKEMVAKIEAQAQKYEALLDFKAKINTAQIEADAKTIAAAFEASAESVAATSQAAASMFDSLLSNIDKLGFVDKWKAWEVVAKQLAMEQQALNLQAKLTEAQIEYMKRKSDALANGDGLIKISSDGLEPALEMIMWEIIEKVQLRVTEESAEFLLGLGVTQ